MGNIHAGMRMFCESLVSDGKACLQFFHFVVPAMAFASQCLLIANQDQPFAIRHHLMQVGIK